MLSRFHSSSILLILAFLLLQTASAQKVGVVLSGGGARGMAHIGVLKALEENNIPISCITGTSIGALVGGLYSMGFSPDEIEAFMKTDDFQDCAQGIIADNYKLYYKKKDDNASWISIRYSVKSGLQTAIPMNLINPIPMDFELMTLVAYASGRAKYNFDSLFIPFRCVAADIDTKKPIVFRNGDLGEAIRASFAFPFYFPPVHLNEKTLYDGGLYNNFPVDVMEEEFAPDYIIGSDVSGDSVIVSDDDNILSQIRTMIVQRNMASVKAGRGVLIEPNVDASLLNFENVDELVYAGYRATMEKMGQIIKDAPDMQLPAELKTKRKLYLADKHEPMIEAVEISGLTPGQSDYIRKILMPRNRKVSLSVIKKRYYKLITDDNIKKIFPKLRFNETTGNYTFVVNIKRENSFIAQFGGNFASRPINQGFIGVQRNFWGNLSLSTTGNVYFGKLYSSLEGKARLDVPGRFQFYLEPSYTRNSWDFFKSSSSFFEDVKPSYLIQNDVQYSLRLGLPVGNKAKLVFGGSLINMNNEYYQTSSFIKADTADETHFDGNTFSVEYRHNTLNRKLYPNAGKFFSLRFRSVEGIEKTVPGSTSISKSVTRESHDWISGKMVFDYYFKQRGNLRFGFYSEVNASNQPFFSNYTASILSAPAFQPIQDMRTRFIPGFHSHNFAGVGLKNIITYKRNLELRMEAYIYQPYEEILQKDKSSAATYGEQFSRRFLLGAVSTIYTTPVGPICLSANYYYDKNLLFEKSWSFMFHFGYIIFNRGALD